MAANETTLSVSAVAVYSSATCSGDADFLVYSSCTVGATATGCVKFSPLTTWQVQAACAAQTGNSNGTGTITGSSFDGIDLALAQLGSLAFGVGVFLLHSEWGCEGSVESGFAYAAGVCVSRPGYSLTVDMQTPAVAYSSQRFGVSVDGSLTRLVYSDLACNSEAAAQVFPTTVTSSSTSSECAGFTLAALYSPPAFRSTTTYAQPSSSSSSCISGTVVAMSLSVASAADECVPATCTATTAATTTCSADAPSLATLASDAASTFQGAVYVAQSVFASTACSGVASALQYFVLSACVQVPMVSSNSSLNSSFAIYSLSSASDSGDPRLLQSLYADAACSHPLSATQTSFIPDNKTCVQSSTMLMYSAAGIPIAVTSSNSSDSSDTNNSSNNHAVAIGVGVGVSLIVLIGLFAAFCLYPRYCSNRRHHFKPSHPVVVDDSVVGTYLMANSANNLDWPPVSKSIQSSSAGAGSGAHTINVSDSHPVSLLESKIGRFPPNPKHWTPNQVASFMASLGISAETLQVLKNRNIDGNRFVSMKRTSVAELTRNSHEVDIDTSKFEEAIGFLVQKSANNIYRGNSSSDASEETYIPSEISHVSFDGYPENPRNWSPQQVALFLASCGIHSVTAEAVMAQGFKGSCMMQLEPAVLVEQLGVSRQNGQAERFEEAVNVMRLKALAIHS
ncbi:hypothetical protein HK100_004600 [Physocladia obscura]|uniref:SAM domain-containing protein n=1 Tax=Physocladia obscura TaxID=109957 RepID=A0AAD5SSP8_9FUNG|nr:hypothetical protein HK100_004600 [Physocladia obscura]